MLTILPKVSSLQSLLIVDLMKVEIQIFQTVTRADVGHFIKGSCLEAPYTKPTPCLAWSPYIFCRCRYIFHLLCDPTRPFYGCVMCYIKYCNFTWFLGTGILWKGIFSAEFRMKCLKLCGNCVSFHKISTPIN